MGAESQCALSSAQNGDAKPSIDYPSTKNTTTGQIAAVENDDYVEESITSTSALRHSSSNEPTREPLTLPNLGHGDIAPYNAPSSIPTPIYREINATEVSTVRNSSIVVNAPVSGHFTRFSTLRVDSPIDRESAIPSALWG